MSWTGSWGNYETQFIGMELGKCNEIKEYKKKNIIKFVSKVVHLCYHITAQNISFFWLWGYLWDNNCYLVSSVTLFIILPSIQPFTTCVTVKLTMLLVLLHYWHKTTSVTSCPIRLTTHTSTHARAHTHTDTQTNSWGNAHTKIKVRWVRRSNLSPLWHTVVETWHKQDNHWVEIWQKAHANTHAPARTHKGTSSKSLECSSPYSSVYLPFFGRLSCGPFIHLSNHSLNFLLIYISSIYPLLQTHSPGRQPLQSCP